MQRKYNMMNNDGSTQLAVQLTTSVPTTPFVWSGRRNFETPVYFTHPNLLFGEHLDHEAFKRKPSEDQPRIWSQGTIQRQFCIDILKDNCQMPYHTKYGLKMHWADEEPFWNNDGIVTKEKLGTYKGHIETIFMNQNFDKQFWWDLNNVKSNCGYGKGEGRYIYGNKIVKWNGQERITKDSNGFPLNYGVEWNSTNNYPNTGMNGRGLLGQWGVNVATDTFLFAQVKKDEQSYLCLRFVVRKDTEPAMLALPGGMVDLGENPKETTVRELLEESFPNKLKDLNEAKTPLTVWAQQNVKFNKDKTPNKKGHTFYSGYVKDPRETNHAWMETKASIIGLEKSNDLDLGEGGGDDADAAVWVPWETLKSIVQHPNETLDVSSFLPSSKKIVNEAYENANQKIFYGDHFKLVEECIRYVTNTCQDDELLKYMGETREVNDSKKVERKQIQAAYRESFEKNILNTFKDSTCLFILTHGTDKDKAFLDYDQTKQALEEATNICQGPNTNIILCYDGDPEGAPPYLFVQALTEKEELLGKDITVVSMQREQYAPEHFMTKNENVKFVSFTYTPENNEDWGGVKDGTPQGATRLWMELWKHLTQNNKMPEVSYVFAVWNDHMAMKQSPKNKESLRYEAKFYYNVKCITRQTTEYFSKQNEFIVKDFILKKPVSELEA